MKQLTLPVSLTAAAAAATIYSLWLGRPASNSSAVVTIIVALAGVATLCSALRGSASLNRWLAVSLVLVMLGTIVSDLVGHNLLSFSPFPDARYAIFLSALLSITILGLMRDWFFARWLALALAGAGILSAGLNLVVWGGAPSVYSWTLAIHIAGSLLVIANLAGSHVRERFELNASEVWTASDPIVRSIRWTILAFIAAVPLLLVYGWMQPLAPATASSAIILACFLALSIGLTMSRKVVGAVGLVIGGLALLAQTAGTVALAYQASPSIGKVSLYYAAFWAPAGLAAMMCGARLAGPVVRLLRR